MPIETPGLSQSPTTAGLSSSIAATPFSDKRDADEQQHRAADVAPLAQQQREEQADAEQLERPLRRLDQRRRRRRARARAPRHALGRRGRTSTANSGIAGLTCATSHIASSARPKSPSIAGQEHARGARATARARAPATRAMAAARPPASAPSVLADEVDDARVARRQEHLQRLHRERQREAGGEREQHARRGVARRGISATKMPNGT